MDTTVETKTKEEEVWAKFVNGEKIAFASIYECHVNMLFSYGMKLCSNEDIVKDSIQDVFIDLFEHRHQLSEPKNLKFYLFKVLKRTIFRKLKKERKNKSLLELNNLSFSTDYHIENRIIDADVEDMKRKLIADTIKTLTAKQQEILYLRFTMGFDYVEISKIMKIDHNSARKQVYRALQKLRKSNVFKDKINIILFYSSFHHNVTCLKTACLI